MSSDAYTMLSRRIGKRRPRNGRTAGVTLGVMDDQNSHASSATDESLSADDVIIVDTSADRCASLESTAGWLSSSTRSASVTRRRTSGDGSAAELRSASR